MKIYSEEETKIKIFNLAASQGCLQEVKLLLAKYEKLMQHCKDHKEREQISIIGNAEIYRLLNVKGGLTVGYIGNAKNVNYVDHKEIIPPDPNIDKIIEKQKDI